MVNQQDKDVAAYLKEIGVKSEITLRQIGMKRGDDWKCDHWQVWFNEHMFDYYTGIGHRLVQRSKFSGSLKSKDLAEVKKLKALWDLDNMAHLMRETDDKESINNTRTIASYMPTLTCPPTQASALYGLMLDMDVTQHTFKQWCAEFGFDDDSIKARELYFACQENAEKVMDIFTSAQVGHLLQLLEDY